VVVACLGDVLVVQAYRVPDGVFGRLWIGEVAHVHLLALQNLVVLEEASQLKESVLGQLTVVFVGTVLGVVEVDADYLLVALAFVDLMCIIPIGRALSKLRGWTGSCIKTSTSSGSPSSPGSLG
jgi:hypothetical protein